MSSSVFTLTVPRISFHFGKYFINEIISLDISNDSDSSIDPFNRTLDTQGLTTCDNIEKLMAFYPSRSLATSQYCPQHSGIGNNSLIHVFSIIVSISIAFAGRSGI